MRIYSEKVDIEGYSLYVNSMYKGLNSTIGDLTILFESGYGNGLDIWSKLQNDISENYRTISYDRAGLGNSDKNPNKRTAENQVKEFHTLLNKVESKGPYVIVAHSIDGLNVRVFANEYPEEVKEIVFVDSTHEDTFNRFSETMASEKKDLLFNIPVYEGDLNEQQESCDQVRKVRENDVLRKTPIVVLAALKQYLEHGTSDVWLGLQNDLASLSDCSSHVIVANCGHYIQEEKPEVVKNAILEVIDKINSL